MNESQIPHEVPLIPLDPTFTLLLATIRAPDDPRRQKAIAERSKVAVDWHRFRDLANRHRVGPLAADGLRSAEVTMPPSLATTLAEVGQRALFAEMTMASEVERILALFSDRHIQAILLKGPGLSLRAFGRLGLRTYRDLDLLVEEEDAQAAQASLIEAGYVLFEPVANLDDLAIWTRNHKDLVFRHNQTGVLVELHWRLFDNRRLLPVQLPNVLTPLGIPPLALVAVLPPELDFRYLCLHGALHGWARLRWLADVNALLARASPTSILSSVLSMNGTISPAVAQALILCRDLLGAELLPEIERRLMRARRANWLAGLAVRELARSSANELEAVKFGSTVKNLSHYALLETPSALLEEMRFDLFAPRRTSAAPTSSKGRVADWIERHLREH